MHFSTQGGMGPALAESPDTVQEIMHGLVREFGHKKTVSAKIRLREAPAAIAEFVREALVSAGCRDVAVHARRRDEGLTGPVHWTSCGVCGSSLLLTGCGWWLTEW